MQKVYTEIRSIIGNVVTVKAEGIRNGDLAGRLLVDVLTADLMEAA